MKFFDLAIYEVGITSFSKDEKKAEVRIITMISNSI